MRVVAVGVAQMVLHVADNRIRPIRKVNARRRAPH